MNAKLKILHLEDLESDAELVQRELKKANIQYNILVVDNKDDYIAALENFSPEIILADHTLPLFDSTEALEILKGKGKKIPFILITATVSEEYAVNIMREGADDYILKDRLQRLPPAVINAIEKYKIEEERQKYFNKVIASEASLQLKNKQLIDYNQIVSHDLRSPVSNIILMADIINEVTDENERKRLFSSLKSTALNINEILNVLVDIAKMSEDINTHSETLFFKEVFDKSCNSLAIVINQLAARFAIDFTECPAITYPKLYLESILINLISNSLKFYSPERSPVISIKTYKEKEKCVMEYADNGLGLDMKKYGDKIFRLNQTFHNDKESKGLGLFMIKNQIEAKGGRIWAESEENKGIKFIIKFAA
ncbi:MAG: hybrid sensor histidine kinase/response regulator [Ginsengibacter sp.]